MAYTVLNPRSAAPRVRAVYVKWHATSMQYVLYITKVGYRCIAR